MDIPQVTYVKNIKIMNDHYEVTRFTETRDYRLKFKAPVLFTAIKDLNVPRYPSVSRIFHYYDGGDAVKLLTLEDLTVDTSQIGLKGSPTNVFRSFVPRKGEAQRNHRRD